MDITQCMAVLSSCSALEGYIKNNVGDVTGWQLSEFLILHGEFPRSIRFCANQLNSALYSISGCETGYFSNEAERLSGMLRSNLNYTTIGAIFETGLHQFLDQTQLSLIDIASAITETYCHWMDE